MGNEIMSDVFQAVRLNDVYVYNQLIAEIDINVLNENGQNLLHEAIAHSNTLLGLDLISRKIDINHQDVNGQTPLHFAAMYNSYELAEVIIKKGGNVNIKDIHQNNALWTAVFNAKGKYEIVRLYTEARGSANSKNASQRSPLDFAKQINDEVLIALLETD